MDFSLIGNIITSVFNCSVLDFTCYVLILRFAIIPIICWCWKKCFKGVFK